MKKNFPINQRESLYPEDEQLISSTDLAGVITHSNEIFARVAGFKQEELLGKSHNIVRHPDMPQAAFADLWETIKAGQPWMGVVKNRCKDGGFYWVDAYVTPVYEKDKLIGFESVRVKPRPEDKARADALYKSIGPAATEGSRPVNARNTQHVLKKLIKRRYLDNAEGRITLLMLLWTMSMMLVCGVLSGDWPGSVASLVLGASGILGIRYFFTPLRRLVKKIRRETVDNPIMQYVYTGSRGEAGQVEVAIQLLQAGQRTILGRIGEHSRNLHKAATEASQLLEGSVRKIDEQFSQTEQVATAVNEMAATVMEVARNTTSAADAAQNSSQQTRRGKDKVNSTATSVKKLAGGIEDAASIMEQLVQDSQNIDKVTVLINEIAEQTNLLALNASIEAARAGEQGRGFAVVATEVSNLAKRTQQATSEIQTMINNLQTVVTRGQKGMKTSLSLSAEGVESTQELVEALEATDKAVEVIKDMNIQISTATEQQSAVAEEINKNVVNIKETSDQALHAAHQTEEKTHLMNRLADELESLVYRFSRE